MSSESTMSLISLLDALGVRARTDDDAALTPAVGLVNDLGILLARGTESDIRAVQAAVASVREQLEVSGHAVNTPMRALSSKDSHSFLAGALWAINESMTARLQATAAASSAPGRQTRRAVLRKAVLASLLMEQVQSPTEILAHINPQVGPARLDEISRVLSELFAEDVVSQAMPEAGSDRRMKYISLTEEGRLIAKKESELLCPASEIDRVSTGQRGDRADAVIPRVYGGVGSSRRTPRDNRVQPSRRSGMATSKKDASLAGKQLAKKTATKAQKSVAASDLAQAKKKRGKN
jgi:hypothetical protein